MNWTGYRIFKTIYFNPAHPDNPVYPVKFPNPDGSVSLYFSIIIQIFQKVV